MHALFRSTPAGRVPSGLLVLLAAILSGPRALTSGEAEGDPSEGELARRRGALDAWTLEPIAIDLGTCLFHLDRRDGSFFLQDARTGVRWFSSWGRRGFASVRLAPRGGSPAAWVPLDRIEDVAAEERRASFRGSSSTGGLPDIRFRVEALDGNDGIVLRYELPEPPGKGPEIERVRLLEDALWIPDSEPGGIAVPRGMGAWHSSADPPDLEIRLGAGVGGTGRSHAIELPFLAPSRSGNSLLVRWEEGGAEARISRRGVPDGSFPGKRGIFVCIETEGRSGWVELRTLGKEWSPVVDGTRAYVGLRHRGELRSLRSKLGARPELVTLIGSALFRPRAGESLTFEAIARHAERVREDLGLDQAAYILSGWAAEGTSASAPEVSGRSGGEEALRACGRRLRKLGFLFGLEVAVPPPEEAEDLMDDLSGRIAPVIALFATGERPGAIPLPVEAESRGKLLRAALDTVGAAAFRPGIARDVELAAYLEGALDEVAAKPESGTFWPILTAAYGRSIRLGVSPDRALGPEDTAALLAHLLVGEVPVYEMPPPARGGTDPAPAPLDPSGSRALFARGDGWAAEKGLTPEEIFLKNTYEVLSHVARIRSREELMSHRAIAADGSVRETYFGVDMRVVVNFGSTDYEDPDDGFLLPPGGFFVRHPFLLAFCALRANGVEYDRPAFFVVRSLEGKMYLRAEETRIYHGFGPTRIRLGGREFEVEREAVVKIW